MMMLKSFTLYRNVDIIILPKKINNKIWISQPDFKSAGNLQEILNLENKRFFTLSEIIDNKEVGI